MAVDIVDLPTTKVSREILEADDRKQQERLQLWRKRQITQRQIAEVKAREVLEQLGVERRLGDVQANWREGQITLGPWRDPISGLRGMAMTLSSQPYSKLALAGKGDEVFLRGVPEKTALQVAVGHDEIATTVFVKEFHVYDVLAARGFSVRAAIAKHGLEEGIRHSVILDKRRIGLEPVIVCLERPGAADLLDESLFYLEGIRESYLSCPGDIRSLARAMRADLPPALIR